MLLFDYQMYVNIRTRTKAREKALECQLEKLAGPNWQVRVTQAEIQVNGLTIRKFRIT